MSKPLTRANFPSVPPLPPASAPPSTIAHIGVGGFHRSHQAFVLNSLISSSSTPWRILGVGLMPWDKKMVDVLASQDFLYSVNLRSASQDTCEIVQAITSMTYLPEEGVTAALLAARIVSLTVTGERSTPVLCRAPTNPPFPPVNPSQRRATTRALPAVWTSPTSSSPRTSRTSRRPSPPRRPTG